MFQKYLHHHGSKYPVVVITAIFILLGSFASGVLSTLEPFLVLGMMLLLGLPHGATDHGLFLALKNKRFNTSKAGFYLAYFALIATYGLVWFFFPVVAFGIFLLLSFYHFGQSNWVSIKQSSNVVARLHYVLWGAGILLTPILLHAGEAIDIVKAMTGTRVISTPDQQSVYGFIAAMALANAACMIALWWQQRINSRQLLLEVFVYALLLTLFFTNSLLLGFSVYFVFWHSLDSAKDQLRFFEIRLSPALRRQLYTEIGMTVIGAFTFCLIVWFGPGPEKALQPAVIGGVFIFISLLTLPHMLLVEQLYNHWSPVSATTDTGNIPDNQIITITQPPGPIKKVIGQELTITH